MVGRSVRVSKLPRISPIYIFFGVGIVEEAGAGIGKIHPVCSGSTQISLEEVLEQAGGLLEGAFRISEQVDSRAFFLQIWVVAAFAVTASFLVRWLPKSVRQVAVSSCTSSSLLLILHFLKPISIRR